MEMRDRGTRDIYNGDDTKAARKTLPRELWSNARLRLDLLRRVKSLNDLKGVGTSLEASKRDRKGQHSIRINQQFRICFIWRERGATAVEITDYH